MALHVDNAPFSSSWAALPADELETRYRKLFARDPSHCQSSSRVGKQAQTTSASFGRMAAAAFAQHPTVSSIPPAESDGTFHSHGSDRMSAKGRCKTPNRFASSAGSAPLRGTQSAEQMALAFGELTASIDSLLAPKVDATGVAVAQEEQERRQRELREKEQRRLLRRQMAHKDPVRKVEARLSIARSELNEQANKSSCVPMRTVNIAGGKGKEEVSIVDVSAMRSRCKQLELGVSVGALLRQQELVDRRAREDTIRRRQLGKTSPCMGSRSMPSLLPSGAGASTTNMHTSVPSSCSSSSERVLRARSRKQMQSFERMLQRFYAMHGEPSELERERLASLAQEILGPDLGAALEAELNSGGSWNNGQDRKAAARLPPVSGGGGVGYNE